VRTSSGGLVGLGEIAKTFLLADLYDSARQSRFASLLGPVALFRQLVAEASSPRAGFSARCWRMFWP
jgi:hypothetical protein